MIEAFVEALELRPLSFKGIAPRSTDRPGYHPAVLLELYVYDYLNPIQSSRRLEPACQRNVEPMWLTERLSPDFKTIVDFQKDNGKAIVRVRRDLVGLCRRLAHSFRVGPAQAIEKSTFAGRTRLKFPLRVSVLAP